MKLINKTNLTIVILISSWVVCLYFLSHQEIYQENKTAIIFDKIDDIEGIGTARMEKIKRIFYDNNLIVLHKYDKNMIYKRRILVGYMVISLIIMICFIYYKIKILLLNQNLIRDENCSHFTTLKNKIK